MEITKAPNQISEIIQQRKTFLGTKTAKNKDSHFSAQDFAPSPCSHSEPGMQLWTTAKERLSIPNPSATISSSSDGESSGRFSGLLDKRQGAREGGGTGLSQQLGYCWSKGKWLKFPELQVGTTQVSEPRYCVAEKSTDSSSKAKTLRCRVNSASNSQRSPGNSFLHPERGKYAPHRHLLEIYTPSWLSMDRCMIFWL